VFSVAGYFDDDLVTCIGQAVQGAVAQDGVIKESQPLVYGPVTGDGETGMAVAGDDQLIEVSGLLGGESLQSTDLYDEQVRSQVGAKGPFKGMIDA